MTAERLVKPWKLRPQKFYVLKNANVVDPVTGTILPNRTVKISAGLITSVTPTEKDYIIVPSTSETTMDLTGKYLCPGLIDNHVHISAVPGGKNLGDLFGLDVTISTIRQPYVCQQMLRRGFTSVRDCGGASLAIKEAINDGLI